MIYLDNHATTRCDDRVIAAMLPWLTTNYGNPHSTSHAMGRDAWEIVAECTASLAELLGNPSTDLIVTSGATESNNLAIKGVCLHPRQKRRKIVSVATEHPAVLDVLDQLKPQGFRIEILPVVPVGQVDAGTVDLNALEETVDDDTALVSVMWANNEMGAIAPMKRVAQICHQHGTLLHSDATQAVGRIPLDMLAADVDLLSASAHKFYGPKGVGLLAVGNPNRRVRLLPQIVGGGQQGNLRSGTVAPAGVIAIVTAMQISLAQLSVESSRIRKLRDQLAKNLFSQIEGLELNGPELDSPYRLPGNLNVSHPRIEGETWMSAAADIAFSSGSACSSVDPEPSHVILALGKSETEARRSVRFGIGRFNTDTEIEQAANILIAAQQRMMS